MNAIPSQADVERFRAFATRKFGLSFEVETRERLSDVLVAAVRRCGNRGVEGYLQSLENGTAPHHEMAVLAQELTITETYFLRHPDHFRAFVENVLPARMRARGGRKQLNLLSAGCASGEEAYSLALLTRDAGLIDAGWEVSVLGLDLNRGMLAKAMAGRYTPWSLRGVPPDVHRRHFREEVNEFILNASVREMAKFAECNFAENDPRFFAADTYDVIFCRNVIMYFTPETAHAVIERFARSLCPGGYLFLGPAETLRGLSTAFHLQHSHDTFYYQRRTSEEQAVAEADGRGLPCIFASASAAGPATLNESWVDSICRASSRVLNLSRDVLASNPGESIEQIGGRNGSDARNDSAGRSARLAVARELVLQERFHEALGALEAEVTRNPEELLLQAAILTNIGRVAEAEPLCRSVLAADELNAEAHYLLALCREHVGEIAAAIEQDQTAVYLDPQFAMPHLHLGLLARRSGHRESARQSFGRAGLLLAREDSSRIALFGGGFGRDALMRLCQAQCL